MKKFEQDYKKFSTLYHTVVLVLHLVTLNSKLVPVQSLLRPVPCASIYHPIKLLKTKQNLWKRSKNEIGYEWGDKTKENQQKFIFS